MHYLRIVFIALMIFFLPDHTIKADNPANQTVNLPVSTIDFSDTIYFDLSSTIVNATTIEFPVYFIADDTVNALDFAIKFDLSKVEYDSLINPTAFLQAFAFYNPNDSTLRFTSYSLSPLTAGSPLVRLRFRIISGMISPADVFPQETYLNGEPCSWKLNDYISSSATVRDDFAPIRIYPTITTGRVRVEMPESSRIIVLAPDFKVLVFPFSREENGLELDLSMHPNGLYHVLVETPVGLLQQRIVLMK